MVTLAGCEKMEDLTDAIDTYQPALILMEHDMRGICGADLLHMLKSRAAYADIPIVYFSGRHDIVELAKQGGADGYLSKPYQAEGLLALTRRYLVA